MYWIVVIADVCKARQRKLCKEKALTLFSNITMCVHTQRLLFWLRNIAMSICVENRVIFYIFLLLTLYLRSICGFG
jgi:hypothetical protein